MAASCDESEILASGVLTMVEERFNMMIRFVFLSGESERSGLLSSLYATSYIVTTYYFSSLGEYPAEMQ